MLRGQFWTRINHKTLYVWFSGWGLKIELFSWTTVKMQVDFWDLLETEPTWLRLFEWAQVVKTNHVNSPWNPQMPNLQFQKTTTAWKFCSKKDQLSKRWLTNYWITSQNGTPWNYFLMLLVYEYFLMPVGLLYCFTTKVNNLDKTAKMHQNSCQNVGFLKNKYFYYKKWFSIITLIVIHNSGPIYWLGYIFTFILKII